MHHTAHTPNTGILCLKPRSVLIRT